MASSKLLLATLSTILLFFFLLYTIVITSFPTTTLDGFNIYQGSRRSVAIRHGGLYGNVYSGYGHTVFNVLPKGALVPPSGPSQSHNEIEVPKDNQHDSKN
ncbi:hypothetical protein PIB30_025497 [Stylosanthes scabra]|uniref:Uncharacterized protein n=1 Tax=Stylosanthes scabra TaxID=79078 RepID=A0ABU6X8X9_9FABA|nr:hypothetical protein [Stylosanthes scabra]